MTKVVKHVFHTHMKYLTLAEQELAMPQVGHHRNIIPIIILQTIHVKSQVTSSWDGMTVQKLFSQVRLHGHIPKTSHLPQYGSRVTKIPVPRDNVIVRPINTRMGTAAVTIA